MKCYWGCVYKEMLRKNEKLKDAIQRRAETGPCLIFVSRGMWRSEEFNSVKGLSED